MVPASRMNEAEAMFDGFEVATENVCPAATSMARRSPSGRLAGCPEPSCLKRYGGEKNWPFGSWISSKEEPADQTRPSGSSAATEW